MNILNPITKKIQLFSLSFILILLCCFCKSNKEQTNENTDEVSQTDTITSPKEAPTSPPIQIVQIDTNLSPLERLKVGNKRFLDGKLQHPDQTKQRAFELKNHQNPFVTMVTCSDSRISPELIFDQGLGDIFTIRTAGNVMGDFELGSIEYAVTNLNCKLVVVMGHQNCGAISAYLNPSHLRLHQHIISIIDYIAKEKEEKILPDSVKYKIDFAVNANIKHGVNLLNNSLPILKTLIDSGKIKVIGAVYSLEKGSVTFFE